MLHEPNNSSELWLETSKAQFCRENAPLKSFLAAKAPVKCFWESRMHHRVRRLAPSSLQLLTMTKRTQLTVRPCCMPGSWSRSNFGFASVEIWWVWILVWFSQTGPENWFHYCTTLVTLNLSHIWNSHKLWVIFGCSGFARRPFVVLTCMNDAIGEF